MQSKYRNILKERLVFYKMWKNDWDLYFFHKSISEKAKKKYYSERKFLNLILSIYFLPLKVFKFIQDSRDAHIYNKGVTLIKVIQDELDETKKINQSRGENE